MYRIPFEFLDTNRNNLPPASPIFHVEEAVSSTSGLLNFLAERAEEIGVESAEIASGSVPRRLQKNSWSEWSVIDERDDSKDPFIQWTKLECFNVTTSDDFVAWSFLRNENDEQCRGCAFLDTESMEITEIPLTLAYGYQILEKMVIRWDGRKSSVIEVLFV